MHNANTQPNQEASPSRGGSWLGRLYNANTRVPVKQAHVNNMLKNIEHRMQVAFDKGDQQLIDMLEAERTQVAQNWG